MLRILALAALLLAPAATPGPSDDASAAATSASIWVAPGLLERAAHVSPTDPLTVLLASDGTLDPDALRAQGFAILSFEHLPVAVAYVAARDLPRLLAQPGILSASDGDRKLELHQLPSIPDAPGVPFVPTAQASNYGGTGDELTRADMARNLLGVSGAGIGLAVIDLGTSGLHPGLRPRELGGPTVQNVKVVISPGRVHARYPVESPVTVFLEDQVNSDLTDGHGTHTAGIAAGQWTEDGLLGGRAPGADLVAIGTGDLLALPWVLGGLEYVLAHHEEYDIRIVSNSWGLQGPYDPLDPVNLATKALADEGILVLFSAGNNGPGIRTMNAFAQPPHVMSIGATTLSGAIATFSSRGDPASGKPGPDLVAPGAEIVSGRNQWVSGNDITYRTAWIDSSYIPPQHLNWYRAVSGTSMSSPQVAGIAALVWEANPDLTLAEIRNILTSTARRIVGFETTAQGPGMVDAYAAVLAAKGMPVPPRDDVQPTFVEVPDVDGAMDYPFHGALLGGPDKSASGFVPKLAFPVYLPAASVDVEYRWRAVGDTVGHKLSLYGADGTLVRQDALVGSAGTLAFDVPLDELAKHKNDRWSAAYWWIYLDLDVGAIEWDLVPRVTYADGALPAVQYDAPPPPPPPPPRVIRAPIVIPDDASFTAANGVVAGTGTIADPYVIAGWEIEPGTGPGISIGGTVGTTAYVVIENVRVHDTTGNCIALSHTQHVTVRDSAFDGCDFAVYYQGGSDARVERNVFSATHRGPSLYGVTGAVIKDNVITDPQDQAIIVGQGFTQQSGPTTNVLIEGNTLLGAKADIFLSSPGVIAAEVRGNILGEGAYINLQIAPMGAVISDTLWLDGVPSIFSRVLATPHPDLPMTTIVDAGSDREVGPTGGTVCFDDARATVLASGNVEAQTWTFGDGGTSTELTPCHTYTGDGPYEARLTVTVSDPTGATKVLSDAALVR